MVHNTNEQQANLIGIQSFANPCGDRLIPTAKEMLTETPYTLIPDTATAPELLLQLVFLNKQIAGFRTNNFRTRVSQVLDNAKIKAPRTREIIDDSIHIVTNWQAILIDLHGKRTQARTFNPFDNRKPELLCSSISRLPMRPQINSRMHNRYHQQHPLS